MTIPSAEECNTWLAVGPASSFSNITTDTARPLAKYIPRSASDGIGCKVFAIQDEDGDTQVAVEMPLDVNDQIKSFKHKREQILVFQYNGKFHAMDNVRLTLQDHERNISQLTRQEMPSFLLSALERNPI
jgi:hypothetical protein